MNRQLSASSFRSRALPALFALLVMACGNSGNLIGPGNQLEVANNPDNFEFQVSTLDNVTQTLSYSWTITGPDATVDIAGAVTAGTATVTITDTQGVEVFSGSLDGSSNPSTSSGTAGSWTIAVTLDGVGGTVNFRVQKKP